MKINKKLIIIGTILFTTTVVTLGGIFVPIYLNKNNNSKKINNEFERYIQYFNEIKGANSKKLAIKSAQKFYGLNFKSDKEILNLKDIDDKSVYKGAIWLGKYIYNQKNNLNINVYYNKDNDNIDQFIIIFGKKNAKKIKDNIQYNWYDNIFNVNHDYFAIVDKRIKGKYKVIDSQFLSGQKKEFKDFKKVTTKANSYVQLLDILEKNNFNLDNKLFNQNDNKYDEQFENLNSSIAIPIIKSKLLEIFQENTNNQFVALNSKDFTHNMIIYNKNIDHNWVDVGFKYQNIEFKTKIFNFKTSDYKFVEDDSKHFEDFDQLVYNNLVLPLKDGEVQENDLNSLHSNAQIPKSANGVTRKYNFSFNKETGVAIINVESKKSKTTISSSYAIFNFKSTSSDLLNNILLFKDFAPKLNKANPLPDGDVDQETLENIEGHPKLPKIVYDCTRNFKITNNSELGEATVEAEFQKDSKSKKISYKITGFKNDKDIVQDNLELLKNISNQNIDDDPNFFNKKYISQRELKNLNNHNQFVFVDGEKETKIEPLFGAKWEYVFKPLDLLNGIGEVNIQIFKGKEIDKSFKYRINGFKKYRINDLNNYVVDVIKGIKSSDSIIIEDANLLLPKANAPANLLIKYGITLPSEMNGVIATFSFNDAAPITKDQKININIYLSKNFGTIVVSKTHSIDVNINGVKSALAKKEIDAYKETLKNQISIVFEKFNDDNLIPKYFKDFENKFIPAKPNKIKVKYQNYKVLGDGNYKIAITFSIDKFQDSEVFDININLSGIDAQLVNSDYKILESFFSLKKYKNQIINDEPIPPNNGTIPNAFFETLNGFLYLPFKNDLVTRIFEIQTNGVGISQVIIKIVKGSSFRSIAFQIAGFKKAQNIIDDDFILFDNFKMQVKDFPNILPIGNISIEALNKLDTDDKSNKDNKLPKLSDGIERKYKVISRDLIKGKVIVRTIIKSYDSQIIKNKDFSIEGFKKTTLINENKNLEYLEKEIKFNSQAIYKKTQIDSVNHSTALDQLMLLGVELPLDLRGFEVFYSHNDLSSNGILQLTLSLKKTLNNEVVILKTFNKTINIVGINDAKDEEILKNYKNTFALFVSKQILNKNFIQKVNNKSSQSIENDLGIQITKPIPSGVQITYSHDYLFYDGHLKTKIKFKLNNVEDEIEIIVNITGINDDKLIAITKEIEFQEEIDKYIDIESKTRFDTLGNDFKTISFDYINHIVDINEIDFFRTRIIKPDYKYKKIIVENVVQKKVTYEIVLEDKSNPLNTKTKTFTIAFA